MPLCRSTTKQNLTKNICKDRVALSPYLFRLTVFVMLTTSSMIHAINFQELLYAENILISSKSSKTANDYLHVVEEESDHLHLQLNQATCCYIAYNSRGTVRFKNGEKVKCTEEATYLGALATERAEHPHKLRKQISAAMGLLEELDMFWLITNYCKRWAFFVFNAGVTGKVLYGPERLEPICSAGNLLKPSQLKGLRTILRSHTTFVLRNNTTWYEYNEQVGSGRANTTER